MTARPWVAVVPQKRLSRAKSRLDLPARDRRRLAEAMLEDTLVALNQVELLQHVVVAWEDLANARTVRLPSKVINVGVPRSNLNGAIATVDRQVRERFPHSNRIVVPGDLPACRSRDVAGLIEADSGTGRSFLTDAHGSGTTVLVARGDLPLGPAYGHRSPERHAASGAQSLESSRYLSLKLDVDAIEDLHSAILLGVGRATQAAVTALGLATSRVEEARMMDVG